MSKGFGPFRIWSSDAEKAVPQVALPVKLRQPLRRRRGPVPPHILATWPKTLDYWACCADWQGDWAFEKTRDRAIRKHCDETGHAGVRFGHYQTASGSVEIEEAPQAEA